MTLPNITDRAPASACSAGGSGDVPLFHTPLCGLVRALPVCVWPRLRIGLMGISPAPWKQETKLGAMLDPIADKAMVVIALMVIIGFSSWSAWLVLPATMILFREVFVSGLREFLGDTAETLKVTKLAKWKTTAQMIAISVLFSQGVFEHYLGMSAWGMDQAMFEAILSGEEEDVLGLGWKYQGMIWSGRMGLWLLWLAAFLTLITGWDYFRKALPHLKDDG